MVAEKPVREAPAFSPLANKPDSSNSTEHKEPVLNVDNIQGNILGGFNKDFQTLLFLKIANVDNFKGWLKSQINFISTAAEAIAFNRLFKAVRKRRGEGTLKATWVNIAFSFNGLALLTDDADSFTDEAFKQGLAARSESLGDPTEPEAEGNPRNWAIGGPDNEADVVLIVASDDRNDMFAEVARIEDSIYAVRSGVQVIFKQLGANLPGQLSGHEHFGFLDGVSQPGIRGLVSKDPQDFLTPRQNPLDRDQGKPGQDLLWPGEFVFGYLGQDPNAKEVSDDTGEIAHAGPAWADDGSFLVFRRLRQDVFAFHKFLRDTAQDLRVPDPEDPHRPGANLVGSRLVGRWASGAPIMRVPHKDDKNLANDDCANNHFEFQKETEAIKPSDKESPLDCSDDQYPSSPGSPRGLRCPFSAHIRKSYPRDDTSESIPGLGEVSTQTHRLLRRGIPYGEASVSTPDAPVEDSVDRGLLFLAYQTSIEDQFEFVTRAWVNNPNFKDEGVGFDPIIGQNNTPGENRRREFTVTFKNAFGKQKRLRVSTEADWVIPTGGGYFFAPSISALELLSTIGNEAEDEVTPEEYAAAIEENIPDRD